MFPEDPLYWKFPKDTYDIHDHENVEIQNYSHIAIQLITLYCSILFSNDRYFQYFSICMLLFTLNHLFAHQSKNDVWYYPVHYSFVFAGICLIQSFKKYSYFSKLFVCVIIIDKCILIIFGQCIGILFAITVMIFAVSNIKWLRNIFIITGIIAFSTLVINDVFNKGNHIYTENCLTITLVIFNTCLLVKVIFLQ